MTPHHFVELRQVLGQPPGPPAPAAGSEADPIPLTVAPPEATSPPWVPTARELLSKMLVEGGIKLAGWVVDLVG